MKLHYLIIIIFIIFNSLLFADKSDLFLNYASVAEVKNDKGKEIIPIEKDTVLHEGEKIKFYIQTGSDCYIYLLFYDSFKTMTLLLPGSVSEYKKNKISKDSDIFLPDQKNWYTLDNNTGREAVYLVVSSRKIKGLEKLLTKIEKADSDKTVLAISRDVRSFLKGMISEKLTSQFNYKSDKAYDIAGSIRAGVLDIKKHVKGLSGKDLIIDIVRFKHE